jgi:hypothetical protein
MCVIHCVCVCVCVCVYAGKLHQEEARTLCEESGEASVKQNKKKQKTGKLHQDAQSPCEEIGEANVHDNH